MPRLREVPRDQVDKDLLPLYDALFGPDRDPVKNQVRQPERPEIGGLFLR